MSYLTWTGRIDGRQLSAVPHPQKDQITIISDHKAKRAEELPMGFGAFANAHYEWFNGKLIQDAFPSLNLDQRELVISGFAFDELIGDEEEPH